jgi:type IV pilus assembly protein PilV
MTHRVNANRKAAGCYAITDAGSGNPYVGAGSGAIPACGTFGDLEQRARAEADLAELDEILKGSAELKGGAGAGAMIGARGCVTMDTSAVPSVYRISIAWQGLSATVNPETVDPALTCARGLYGDERLRRVVSVTFPMAKLN